VYGRPAPWWRVRGRRVLLTRPRLRRTGVREWRSPIVRTRAARPSSQKRFNATFALVTAMPHSSAAVSASISGRLVTMWSRRVLSAGVRSTGEALLSHTESAQPMRASTARHEGAERQSG
jgi:hypothetical protein